MTTKRIAKEVLENIHQAAKDLMELEFIDKNHMAQYEAICLQPIPNYDQTKIRALRDRYKLSQAAFAIVLNTSASTIRKWEVGDKHPSGPSLKLLDILDRKGLEVLI